MSQISQFRNSTNPPGSTAIDFIQGDTGGMIGPDATYTIYLTGGTTGLTFSGSGHTETLTGVLGVPNGGTGDSSFTAYSVICAGTTSTGTFQNVSGLGTSGQILTSQGAGSLPHWAAAPSTSITITGDTGGGLTGTSFTFTGGTTGLTFAGAGTTETLGGTLAVKNGGTGAATLTGVLIGNGTSAVTGNAVTQYDVLVGGASNAISSVGPGSAGQVLQSGGAAANPAYSTATYPATTTINQLLYSSSNNVVAGVTAGDYGVLISSSSGVPSWLANGTTGQILTATTSGTPSWENVAASSITITGDSGGGLTGNSFTFTGGSTGLTFAGSGSTETLGGDLVVAYGGTGNTTFTAYSVICAGTTATGAFQNVSGLGSSGNVLTSQGAGSLPHWAAPAASSITITGDSGGGLTGNSFTFTGGTTGLTFAGAGSTETLGGTLVVSNGGTGRATLTNHGLLVGAGTAAITQLVDATNGQLPIGSTGADPVLATLSAGAGISISNGAGSITISNTGAGFTWFDVTGGSATLAAESGYIADKSTLTTFTMPTNNAIGDTIKIVGKGTGLWKIVYTTGQNIVFGSSTSTTTTGNISSTNAGDCIEMVCTTASASAPIFTVVSSIGSPSIT
jgi:trimeric autotransporter adhesin